MSVSKISENELLERERAVKATVKAQRKVVIAHISDLHIGDHDQNVWDYLNTYILSQKPNIIVVTGDIVDSPKPSYFADAASKLEELYTSGERIIMVVPGNHDYELWGLFGSKMLASLTQPFGNWSLCWKNYIGRYWKDYFVCGNVALFSFDSNPLLGGLAKGNVGLRRFEKSYEDFRSKNFDTLDSFYKIALLHHHPMPIPYSAQFESFSALSNAGEFIRKLTEKQLDLILHGHKHNAVTSRLILGTVNSEDRHLSLVACGTSSKKMEGNPDTTHTCNIITVHENRRVEIKRAFAPPGRNFAEQPSVSCMLPPEHEYLAKRHTDLEQESGCKLGSFICESIVDSKGDAKFVTRKYKLSVSNEHIFEETGVLEEKWQVDKGSFHRASYLSLGNVPLTGEEVRDPDPKTGLVRSFSVIFRKAKQELKGGVAASYKIAFWGLNSFASNSEEFKRMYPNQSGPQLYEEVSLSLNVPVTNWCVRIKFVEKDSSEERRGFEGKPLLYIYKQDIDGDPEDEREHWLEAAYESNLKWSIENRWICMCINKPLKGYAYKILWRVPDTGSSVCHDPKFLLQTKSFAQTLKSIRDNGTRSKKDELFNAIQSLEKEVQDKFKIASNEDLDVSLMVREVHKQEVSKLIVVALNNQKNQDFFDFSLEVGDGIAGKAFKFNEAQLYIQGHKSLKKPQGYIPIGKKEHSVLYSVPLRHPKDDNLLLGILNVGSFAHYSKLVPSENDRSEYFEYFISKSREFVLGPLSKIVGVSFM